MRKMRTTNAMVKHLISHPDHAPAWDKAKVLHDKLSNTNRKLIEACLIATRYNVNTSKGRYGVSQFPAKLVIEELTGPRPPPRPAAGPLHAARGT